MKLTILGLLVVALWAFICSPIDAAVRVGGAGIRRAVAVRAPVRANVRGGVFRGGAAFGGGFVSSRPTFIGSSFSFGAVNPIIAVPVSGCSGVQFSGASFSFVR